MVKQTSCFQLTKPQKLELYKGMSNSALILMWKSAELKAKVLFIPAFFFFILFGESKCTYGVGGAGGGENLKQALCYHHEA